MDLTDSIAERIYDYLDTFDESTLYRGESYYNEGRVGRFQYSLEPLTCAAQVRGSGRNIYVVTILEREGSISTACTCPMSRKCKHIVAALLELDERLMPDLDLPTADETAVKEPPPPPISSQVKGWIDSLSSPAQAAPHVPASDNRFISYALGDFTNNPKIELLVYYLKKDGTIGKAAPQSVNITSMFNSSISEKRALFTEEDWKIVFAALQSGAVVENAIVLQNRTDACKLLMDVAATGRLRLKNDPNKVLHWGEKRTGTFEWKFQPSTYSQKLTCVTTPASTLNFSGGDQLFYLDATASAIGLIEVGVNKELIPKLMYAPSLSLDEVNQVADYFAQKKGVTLPIVPQKVDIQTIKAKPKPHLTLTKRTPHRYGYYSQSEELTLIPSFSYEGHLVPKQDSTRKSFIVESPQGYYSIERSLAKESARRDELVELGMRTLYNDNKFYIPARKPGLESEIQNFLTHYHGRLKDAGWEIHFDETLPVSDFVEVDDWYIDTQDEGNGWFNLEMGVDIGGERINILPLLRSVFEQAQRQGGIAALLESESVMLVTEDKKILSVPTERIRRLIEAFALEFDSHSGDKLRLPEWNAHLLNELMLSEEAASARWFGDEHIKKLATSLSQTTGLEPIVPSEHLKSTLRPYQQEGLNWLQFLRRHKINGILADDMGLGKTVQVLSHIQAEVDAGRATDPILIVVPKSLLFNWVNEIGKHTPTLSHLVVHGTDRKEKLPKLANYNLILTTYSLVPRDKKQLMDQHFHMIVLDEAQNIKNPKTQAYLALQQMKATHRICLTGTPMENHLGELWSLYNFLMPGYLGSQKQFQQIFRKPIEKERDSERQNNLSKRLSPVLLRRTKNLVASDLPDKTEIIERVEFSDDQRDLYETIRIRVQQKLMDEIAKKGIARSQIAILDALLKLRQVCCDPRLLKTNKDISGVSSAKLDHLMELVPTLIEEGRALLIFSQFTSMLELIQEELNKREIPFTLLTGQTEDRKTPVDRFQNGEVPVMLLSLKAGGVGLNLTRADTVIHYDPWWNPAAENQATDRAHRIGQTNKVFVYKLIASGSIEEKILSLQQKKQELIGALLENKDSASLQLSMEDLQDIFQPL